MIFSIKQTTRLLIAVYSGLSKVDAIYMIAKQLMEKAYQHKTEIKLLFIDFQ